MTIRTNCESDASAWVKSGPFRDVQGMSALPPIADMCSAEAHVCFGPIADIAQRHSMRRGHPSVALKRPYFFSPCPVVVGVVVVGDFL